MNTTAPKKAETGVIHGRFQVLHNDHMVYLLAGMALCEHLVIGITNPDPLLTKAEAQDPKRSSPLANPLTYFERYLMVQRAMMEAGVELSRFSIVPLPINLPELYQYYVPMDGLFFLSVYDQWGKRKLEYFHSLNLKTHVLRDVPESQKGISATEVRERMIHGERWEDMVPPAVVFLMKRWDIPARLRRLQECAEKDGH